MTSLLRALASRVIEGEIVGAAVSNKLPVPIVSTHPSFVDSMSSGGLDDGGDKEAQAGAMTANGTLFAIVGGISFDVSAVEWKLYRKAASGKAEDRTEVSPGGHPSQELFDQPNPFMPWQEFAEVVQQHMELTGEGWSLTAFALGLPLELWPVYPHRMVPIPDPMAFLSGYVYLSPDGQKIPLGLREVTQLRQPHPLNMFRGLSAVQAIASDLSAGRAASAWNDRFFRNSAIPGGIIEQDIEASGLSDDEFKTFVIRWREAHQGVQNAHRVAVLEQGMKWVPNAYSLKDLQFTELRGMSRDVVREAYRYPISKLGTVEDVNRANGEAQETRYGRDILKPRLTRWKSWRNREIMPLFGGDWRNYEWDHAPVEPEDTEQEAALLTARATAWVQFVTNGVDGKAAIGALKLPPELGDAWTKVEPPAPALPGAAPGKRPAPKKAAWSTWLTNEAAPDELGEQWQSALDETLAAWQAAVSPAQRDAAVAAVEQALSDVPTNGLGALGAIAVPVAGARMLAARMVDLAARAGRWAVDAAADVGAVISYVATGRGPLDETADAAAGLLAQAIASAAGREAARLYRPGMTAAEVAADVRLYLVGLSDRSLRDALGGALTKAQNAGLLAVYGAAMSAPPPGWVLRLYGDEMRDGSVCVPCQEINGAELPTVDAAVLAYGGAGYLWCEGGVRCRGTVVGRWEREV